MIIITDEHKPGLSKMGILARELMDIRLKLKESGLPETRIKELQLALAEKKEAYNKERALIFKK